MRDFDFARVWAIVVRHLYNFKSNYDRLVDAFYWPAVDLVLFGLTVKRFSGAEGMVLATIVLGICMWFVVWRAQGDITVSLLEEIWSENVANLFASPLTVKEWIVGLVTVGILKLIMTLILLGALAFILYEVNVTAIGWMGVVYILSLLLTGWTFGFLSASLFLRYGTSVQTLAWAGPVILMPFSGTYFPLSVLPGWAQSVAVFVPSSYVFESMRQLVYTGMFDPMSMVKSFGLNLIYIILATWLFAKSYQKAKEQGLAHLK